MMMFAWSEHVGDSLFTNAKRRLNTTEENNFVKTDERGLS